MEKRKNRLSSLDGLRAFAAIAIVIFHVFMRAPYDFNNWFANEIIYKLGTLVSLFMVISAFSMCCGYYDKIKNNQISLNDFYKRRYIKILPFFFIMVFIDIVVSKFNSNNMIEGFANLTLLFAFIPNTHIEVIGVAWTLGVIFAFYVLFPFFVFMIWDKKRAWLSFLLSLLLSYFTRTYFIERILPPVVNIIFWLPYFVVGGLIFLYKDQFLKNFKDKKIVFILFIFLFTTLLRIKNPYIVNIDLYEFYKILNDASLVILTIASTSFILDNRITRFISIISFEIYLSHTMMIRVVEMLGVFTFTKSNSINIIVCCVIVLVLTVLFAYFATKIIELFFKQKARNEN